METGILQHPGLVRMATMRLAEFTGWLFGCAHRNTSFPRCAAPGVGAERQQGSPADTYIVCLDCGRRFAYDWKAMRMKRLAWIRRRGAGPVH